MEILAIKTGPIEALHHPIPHIARAMSRRVIVTAIKLGTVSTQVQGMSFHGRIRKPSVGPFAQPPQPLREYPFGGRLVGLPHPLLDLLKSGA
jgi:hypothetical protein